MNKKIYQFKRLIRDISRGLMYNECIELSPRLGKYYIIIQENKLKKLQKLICDFDNNGIPINKPYIDVPNKKNIYYPITIGMAGLAVFNTYLISKLEKDKQRFLKFCDWFYHNALIDELGVRWMTDVALPQYHNTKPWQSAFAQSRGISVLLRGYQLTNKIEYAEMAKKALMPFEIAVSSGGVTSFTEWGPFYEEYTASIPTLVLNGMMFSLFGLCDYCRVFSDTSAQQLYENGLDTLENILPQFDLGYWSRLNLCRADWYPRIDPATLSYQKLHILQLHILYKLTQRPVFKKFADRFNAQIRLNNICKSYFLKYKALKKLNRI